MKNSKDWTPAEFDPEHSGRYLCTLDCDGSRLVDAVKFDGNNWETEYEVISWRELPEPSEGYLRKAHIEFNGEDWIEDLIDQLSADAYAKCEETSDEIDGDKYAICNEIVQSKQFQEFNALMNKIYARYYWYEKEES